MSYDIDRPKLLLFIDFRLELELIFSSLNNAYLE